MFRRVSHDVSSDIRVMAFPEGRLRVTISQGIGRVTRDGGGGADVKLYGGLVRPKPMTHRNNWQKTAPSPS
jgi:hypothetical protein